MPLQEAFTLTIFKALTIYGTVQHAIHYYSLQNIQRQIE